MANPAPPVRDLLELVRPHKPHGRISTMAAGLVGSEILKIAADIRALVADGQTICNLTVGDFSPAQFPIPRSLSTGIQQALLDGETNYPPPNGVPTLRDAVCRFYERELGLKYPVESVLIAGGARPAIYGTYRALIDPGDRVLYPVPSWNNNHYCHMLGAEDVAIACTPENRFLPTREALVQALPRARLLALNSPLNPTGTAFSADVLRDICNAVLDENAARDRRGDRPLYVMYDHIYWMLTVAGTEHVTPPGLVPEMARYTIFVDGISKAFAATGVRVGWAVGPVDVIERMSAILGHVGAWAPRAEQVATIALLDDVEGIRGYHEEFMAGISRRLRLLHEGFQAMRAEGLPVDTIPPMGAIYLTARIHPFGRRTPDGRTLDSNESVRRFLLEQARVGVVPFQAFGVPGEDGWFRLSVGAVSEDEIRQALPRVAEALKGLT